jgi:adenine-specific DNA-methyltransferase
MPAEFEGRTYEPGRGGWKTNSAGFERLRRADRLEAYGKTLSYRRFVDDFPYFPLSNAWTDTASGGYGSDKIYVVQTNEKVVQRCILMTTAPGDLVLDPTCGSGTTAYVAEQWGRRWITIDTSRVPLALARQRLLTGTFPWYELADPKQGPVGGFVYQRRQNRRGEEVGGLVPRITLKSIANEEPPEMVTLVDRPEVNSQITRVAGPFAVEATIAAARIPDEAEGIAEDAGAYDTPRAWIDRMIETLRAARELRLPGNRSVALARVRPIDGMEHLHAEAELKNGKPQKVAIAFGPRDAAVDQSFAVDAHREAYTTGFDQLFIFGFAIEAGARQALDRLKLPTTYVAVTPDVVMSDLLKTNRASEIFSVTGLPDVEVLPAGRRDDGSPLYKAKLRGLDVFFPDRMEADAEDATESVPGDTVPCWMLDTDYNGMCFHASQVFFPKTAAWDNLKRALRANFDESLWEHLAGTESEPFPAGERRRIAVKVIDERGNELMAVRELS